MQEGGADPTAGADDEHRIPGLDLGDPVQDLVRNQVIEDQGHRFRDIQGGGNVHELVRRPVDVLGIAAIVHQGADAVAHRDLGDPLADGIDDADHGVPRHERQLG